MEEPGHYNVGEGLNLRDSTIRTYDDGWEAPSTDEIRSLISHMNLSGSQVGRLVGVNGRTVRKWTGGENGIPYAAWRLLLISAGKAKQ